MEVGILQINGKSFELILSPPEPFTGTTIVPGRRKFSWRKFRMVREPDEVIRGKIEYKPLAVEVFGDGVTRREVSSLIKNLDSGFNATVIIDDKMWRLHECFVTDVSRINGMISGFKIAFDYMNDYNGGQSRAIN